MPTSTELLSVMKQRDNHKLAECVQRNVQAQGKRAGRIDPFVCECRGCPDRPMRCKDRILFQTFDKHLSAFSNLCELWRQFHFTLAGQIRGPLANCLELGTKQLRNCAGKAWIIRFTVSGKREIEWPCDELGPEPQAE